MALTEPTVPRLDCGAELEPLVVQVFDGAPPADPGHHEQCPYCQGALERLHAVTGALGTLAAEPVSAPPSLARSVMQRLRRDQDKILVGAHPRGSLTIDQAVLTLIARRAALTVPDVRFASVQIVTSGAVAPLRLSARVTIGYGPSLIQRAEDVRDRIQSAVAQLTGVPVAAVDVLVDDLA